MDAFKKVPMQDIAPPGGYPNLDVRAISRTRGPSGWAMFAGMTAFIGYGFYKMGQHNIKRREVKWERKFMRMAIMPYLQAEGDRNFLVDKEILDNKEKEIMRFYDENWDPNGKFMRSGHYMHPTKDRSWMLDDW
eukprot:CAMPEP_0113937174 /NCGR_PEP_ID=MMETSP1339-20121228/3860_1 /TAXON_ID=94617 /ORGANISM="Fibrocapsa japonica" /LENGTH=133 /DNA_ID=CAMNT_0000939849 /DNA_START=87 /DNA_END=485 /DNA_ORIENTATION=- /assembly_acc=CAM_ASM_000762